MKKNIVLLGTVILIYGFYFYLLPLINEIKSVITNTNLLRTVYATICWDVIGLVLHTVCGIGIVKLNKIARKVWLIYSTCFILIGTPFVIASIQNIIKGFYKSIHMPLYYLVQSYSLFFILIYSLIFLNLPKTKLLFSQTK